MNDLNPVYIFSSDITVSDVDLGFNRFLKKWFVWQPLVARDVDDATVYCNIWWRKDERIGISRERKEWIIDVHM